MSQGDFLIITLHADPAEPSGVSGGGGTHAYVRELMREAAVNRRNCIVVTRRFAENLPQVQRISDYCTLFRITIGENAPMDKRRLNSFHDSTVAAISDVIASQENIPDIIHSVYWNSGRAAHDLSRKLGIPYVHTVISNGKRRLLQNANDNADDRLDVEQLVYDNATAIFSISDQEKRDLVDLYSVSAKKIFIVGRPVADCFINPPQNSFGEARSELGNSMAKYGIINSPSLEAMPDSPSMQHRVFVYVGRIAKSKGLPQIVDVWSHLKEKYGTRCPALWLVGGDTQDIMSFRSSTSGTLDWESHEANRDIVWWGYLDGPGISTILLKAAALVTHSKYEPGGRVVLEAMAQGVPIIATPFGFANDLIDDWHSGFLVDFGDTRLLRRRLDHFIQQPQMIAAMGHNARNQAATALKEWDFARSHHDLYDKAINKQRIASGKAARFTGNGQNILARRALYPQVDDLPQSAYLQSLKSLCRDLKIDPKDTTDVESLPGKAHCWKISLHHGEDIFIKRFHSHFRVTPIWLRSGAEVMVSTAQNKLNSEMVAALLPGFCPLLGVDEKRSFAIKPWLGCPQFDGEVTESARLLKEPAEKLWLHEQIEVPRQIQSILKGARSVCRTNSVYDLIQTCQELIRHPSIETYYSTNMISVGLWLVLLKNLLHDGAVVLEQSVRDDFFTWLPLMLEWATLEIDEPIVFSHGNIQRSHYLHKQDGSICFADGETLHRGFWGRDAGEIVRELVWMFPDKSIAEILPHLDESKERQQLALVWAICFEFNSLARHATLHFPVQHQQSLTRMKNLLDGLKWLGG